MKKAILIGMVLVLVLFLLPSCAAGVPQEEYDRVSSDLAAAQTQIQSLQGDLTAAQGDLTAAQTQIQSLQGDLAKAQTQVQPLQDAKEAVEAKRAEASVYAEYLDMLMYPLWKEAELTPRFAFESDIEWMMELKNRADDMGDAELGNYLEELMKGDDAAMNLLWNHCLDSIEKALK